MQSSKKVISYSLWGNLPKYWVGAMENIKDAKIFYPGWTCRFYVDVACDPILVESLKDDHVEIIMVEPDDFVKNTFYGALWRYLAADDPTIDILICRDCDSRLGNREVAAVNEWLASDKDVHIMRDHPLHKNKILGGMWGVRNGVLRKYGMASLIDSWDKELRFKGCNEKFLGEIVYPLIEKTAMEHSEFDIKFNNDVRSFPTPRQNYEFVGEVFNANNKRNFYWEFIKKFEEDKKLNPQ